MNKVFAIKYLLNRVKKYLLIFLTIILFLLVSIDESIARDEVFTIDKVIVEGPVDLKFSREKYYNKAFLNSFSSLMYRVLLSKDLNKISNIKLKEIKRLISSFQVLDETYKKDEYKLTLKIFYNDIKVKKLLEKRNLSFSQPKKISTIFFPVLFINEEMKDFDDNYFYKQWAEVEIKNKLINYILPLEDLEDLSNLNEMKNRIEEIDVNSFVNKYNVKNYVFAFMDYQNKQLDVYLKTNFNNSKVSKNISYEISNINDKKKMKTILKDLKMQITDIWKKENIINLSIPLSLNVRFKYNNIKDLEKLKNIFYKINIIDNYSLEKLSINESFFIIDYYGNPKKLQIELSKFDYKLKNDQGYWMLYKNE